VDVAALEPGRHRVRVARDGYAPAQLSLEIQAGTPPPPLQFVMTPLATLVPTDPEPPRAATASLTVSTGARAATAKTVSPPPPVAGRGQPEPLLAAWVHELEHDPNITRPRRLSGPEVRYPEAARRLRFGGMVLVEMVVTERGRPEDVRVLHGAGDVLDRAVVDAVRGWKFEPARKGGRPVRVRWRYSQNFDPSA
jgi:protein TonB